MDLTERLMLSWRAYSCKWFLTLRLHGNHEHCSVGRFCGLLPLLLTLFMGQAMKPVPASTKFIGIQIFVYFQIHVVHVRNYSCGEEYRPQNFAKLTRIRHPWLRKIWLWNPTCLSVCLYILWGVAPLLGNDSKRSNYKTAVAKKHVSTATMHCNRGTVFSTRSVLRCYKQNRSVKGTVS
jgi:hypothetical protein